MISLNFDISSDSPESFLFGCSFGFIEPNFPMMAFNVKEKNSEYFNVLVLAKYFYR